MKKIIMLFAGVVLAASMSVSAFGQAAGPQGGGIQSGQTGKAGQQGKHGAKAPIGEKLLKQLNLTDDQKNKIKELGKTFMQKREDLQKNSTSKGERKDLANLRKQFLEDVKNVLTPEQQAKLKQLMEEARNKAKKGIGGGTATGGSTTGSAGGGGTTTSSGGKSGGGL